MLILNFLSGTSDSRLVECRLLMMSIHGEQSQENVRNTEKEICRLIHKDCRQTIALLFNGNQLKNLILIQEFSNTTLYYLDNLSTCCTVEITTLVLQVTNSEFISH